MIHMTYMNQPGKKTDVDFVVCDLDIVASISQKSAIKLY